MAAENTVAETENFLQAVPELTDERLPPLRFAAGSDFHIGGHHYAPDFLETVNTRADALFLVGDMTDFGRKAEWLEAIAMLEKVRIPTFLVLGNHDDIEDGINDLRAHLKNLPHVRLLEGHYASLMISGRKVGIVGGRGSEGGFGGDLSSELDQSFAEEVQTKEAEELSIVGKAFDAMTADNPDVRIALLHYVPFAEGVRGQEPSISWIYGSSKFGDLMQEAKVDLALHGHFHGGRPDTFTLPSGLQCANVALPLHSESLSFFEMGSQKVEESIVESKG